MRKVIPLITLLFFCSFPFAFPDDYTSKVVKSAQDNLAASLAKIPKGQEKYYGFSSREEFKTCAIGKPYRVITLNNDFYSEEKTGNKNYFLLQNEWRVPVTVNGENRLLLTIIQNESSFDVVDLGGATLAKEIGQKKSSESYDTYLLRIYPLAFDFLVAVKSEDFFADASYFPLTSAIIAIPSLDGIAKLDMPNVLSIIKQQLKEQHKN